MIKKTIIVILGILAFILLVKTTGLNILLDQEKIQPWIKSFGIWGWLIYILIYILNTVLLLPALPITLAAGIIFGPVLGTILAISGATLGSSLAFIIARYTARDLVKRLLKNKLAIIDTGVKEKGWIFVAITRLIPLFPYNLINYAFGLTEIKFSTYVICSFIFMLPATAAYVVFSSSIVDIFKGDVSVGFITGVILIVLITILSIVYKKSNPKINS